jgi:hypothetical protein
MYNSLDNIIADNWFASDQPRPKYLRLLWHHNKLPREIQATAELIQATCTDKTRNPIYKWVKMVKPDFLRLLEEKKAREYQIIEFDLDNFGNWG